MPRAAIDIGSNSVLLTVMGPDGEVLHDEARVVGLGKGLGDRGLFKPETMKKAEDALAEFVHTAQRLGVDPWEIKAVATSAARRAMNAETFFAKLTRKHGLRVRIISGDEEARLTWLGVKHDLQLPASAQVGPLLVVDLGGGSTEMVFGSRDTVTTRTSLEIGSVRLTEHYLLSEASSGTGTGTYDPQQLPALRKHVDMELSKVSFDPIPKAVVGVAGTVTTLAAMSQRLERYDGNAVHGSLLTRNSLQHFIDALLVASPADRLALAAVSPERADYLLAGAVILERVLHAARRQQMIVSDRGLRYGLLAR